MKTIIMPILIFATLAGQAQQQARQDTIYAAVQSYGDSVVVRWAPGSVRLWQIANKVGYKVERRRVSEKDFVVVSEGALKPYSLAEWKRHADTTNVHVATAAQVLLGELMMQPQKAVSFSQKLLTSEEQQNRMALALYSAEFSVQAANGLALRWVDKNISADGKYFYRVSLSKPAPGISVIPAVARVNVSDRYHPRAVAGIEAVGKDGVIEVRWDKNNDSYFSGYFVEVSENGKDFKLLESIPYKSAADGRTGSPHVYKHAVAEYHRDFHYRVRGMTSFADYGAYSAIVTAHTRDLTAPAPPAMLKAESLDDKRIRLTWIDSPAAGDHSGYYIGRGTSVHGPFEKINQKPLKNDVRTFVDEKPIRFKSNFYTIIATDASGNENNSMVAMAVLRDYTPPGVPIGLTGAVDTLGVVSLAWNLGSEEDLMGYRVYRSNHPDQSFVQITREPVPGNFYMDTIPLNTLTKKVYYKVAAFDFNYNPSEFSKVLELNRPDYSPPVKPVIRNYLVKGDTVEIDWARSSSKDVARHVVYKREGDGEWQSLGAIDADGPYSDITTRNDTRYSYALEAFDESGLGSGKSTPILVRTNVKGHPPVQTITGAFDEASKAFRLEWKYDQPGNYKFVVYRGEQGTPLKTYDAVPGGARVYMDREFYLNTSGYVYALKVLFPDGTESGFSEEVAVTFRK